MLIWNLLDGAVERSADGTNVWQDASQIPPDAPVYYRIVATNWFE